MVTGGAGFIGANFVRTLLRRTQDRLIVLDKLTYAGNLESLKDILSDSRFKFVQGDISDRDLVRSLMFQEKPFSVINLAAETHVDRSIDNPRPFIETNLVGTFELLEASRLFFKEQDSSLQAQFRFVHVSTDEVYGTLGPSGLFSEETPYAPNSPYSASKAGADHMVRAYFETYHLPTLITNCSNNYGPFQFPEKLIPLIILNALESKPLPVYGDGQNVRDWLYVGDHCEGIWQVVLKGKPGEKYNIGSRNEQKNIDVVRMICDSLEEWHPAKSNPALQKRSVKHYRDLMSFVPDRPGHDRRYAIDPTKIRDELGWAPQHDFKSGLNETVKWYLDHRPWCEAVQAGKYRGERLGVIK